MEQLLDELRETFEDRGFTVEDVSRNRRQVRIALLAADAPASEVRSIPVEVAGEDAVMGVNVTTETIEGTEDVRTVVTFRHRG